MNNILVTGGCGFIGSHVALGLLNKGYNVTILDSNINSSENSIDRISYLNLSNNSIAKGKIFFFKGDIRDIDLLEKIFCENIKKNSPINAVIHLAGLKSVKNSFDNPLLYWDVNVRGSIALFNAMIKYGCFNLVFSSSATVYGNPISIPIFEYFETKPINPYGKSKLKVENIIKSLFQRHKLEFRAIILRYFNPLGAHYSGNIGENYNLLSENIFPKIINVALGKSKYLKIFGNDWPTHDGTAIRDFIHIMDLADGHIKAIDYLRNSEPKCLTLNLGTGVKTSLLELISSFELANSISIPYKFCKKRVGDTPILLADNTLAGKVLNWYPKKSVIDMCRDGWNFAKKS